MAASPPIVNKIPKVIFDYFDLGEVPDFILCNPNKEELFSLGAISERKLSARFNTLSEVSFRADKYINGEKMEYYDYLVNKRLINVISGSSSVGYYMITESSETDDGISKYKEIKAQSLEVELSGKRLVVYISGSGIYTETGEFLNEPVSVTLEDLLDDLIDKYIPEWSHGLIPSSPSLPISYINTKRRGFDVSDKTIYDFLMTDVAEAYGCVFDFDTVEKIIYIYDPDTYTTNTDIFISHNNIVKSLQIEEVTDELSTCLNVTGDGIDIRAINPLGDNYLYRFNYFTSGSWMSTTLINNIASWQAKVSASTTWFSTITSQIYNDSDTYEVYSGSAEIYSGCAAVIQTELDALLAQNPQDPIAIAAKQEQQVLTNALLIETIAERDEIGTTIRINTELAGSIVHNAAIDNYKLVVGGVNPLVPEGCTFTVNFSEENYKNLQPFIIQSSYVNDKISTTSITSNSSTFELMNQLYTSACAVLVRVSEPKYTFEIDSINFMQIKEFQLFRDQIALGAQVTFEIKDDVFIYPLVLGMDMNFDNPDDFSLTFGTRLRLDDEGFKFSDLMNKALDSGNSAKVYSKQWNQWSRTYKKDVTDTITPIDSAFNVGSRESIGVFDKGFKEGVYINTGSYVNIITPRLLWNGLPIGTGGGGAAQNLDVLPPGGGTSVEEGPGIDIAGNAVGLGGDTILLYHNNGNPVEEFTTITAALQSAQSGNLVLLPPGTFYENILIPLGVIVASIGNNSTIRGVVTLMGEGSNMKGVTIDLTLNSNSSLYGVLGNASGSSILNNCIIKINNMGVGNAYSVNMRGGNLTLWNCVLQNYSKYGGNSISVYSPNNMNGILYSSDSYYTAIATGTGKGHAFVNNGTNDWYITAGKIIATTSPVGEISEGVA